MPSRFGVPAVGPHRPLVVSLVVDAVGSGLFLPFTVLFFLATTPLSIEQVGLGVSAGSVVRLVAGPVAGALADRLGPQRVLLAANLLQGAGYLGFLAVGSLPGLLLATAVVQAGNAAFWSSYPPLVAAVSRPGQRELWFGFLGAARNTGFGLGSLLAGLAVSVGGTAGYRGVAAANAVSYVLAALLLLRHHAPPADPASDLATGPAGSWRTVLADRPYLGLTAANIPVALTGLSLTLAMPVWATELLGLPAWVPGAAVTVNCLLVAGAQGPVVLALTGHRRVRALQLAAVLHVVAAVVLLAAAAVPVAGGVVLVVAGVVVLTAGELVESPVSSALAAEAAPPALRGRYLAVHQSSWNLASIVGPVLLTALLARGGAAAWGGLAAVSAAGGVGITLVARHLPAARAAVGAAGPADDAVRNPALAADLPL